MGVARSLFGGCLGCFVKGFKERFLGDCLESFAKDGLIYVHDRKERKWMKK